ncbi:MAG TPA: selenocysteine-specific translation elongation factor [Gemmatimonadota bacterium]
MILGTAGHVDHGKTDLVHALTGIRTDRLPEERERGISIDVGFAVWEPEPGLRVGVVDVPGHVDFVRNMVAGASGVDAALFVVAADEGMRPQSREHLLILEELGVRRGVVALTKSDLVEGDWLELVSEEVGRELAGSFLAAAPRVPVSSRTGAGLDELRRALLALMRTSAPDRAGLPFRMPVDRVFTVRGVGTVVTGTPWSGRLPVDGEVRVLPGGGAARVRSIETHGRPAGDALPGRRAALALTGVERDRLRRGSAVVQGDHWRSGRLWEVHVGLRSPSPRELRSGTRVRVLLGTGEVAGRLVLAAGASPLVPGAVAFGQLRLDGDLVAARGDRFVLRTWSPVETIGGGVVLRRSSRKAGPRRLADAAWLHHALLSSDVGERLEGVLRARGAAGASPAEAAFEAGAAIDGAAAAIEARIAAGAIVREGQLLYSAGALAGVRAAIVAELDAWHARERIRRGVGLGELRERVGASPPLFERALGELQAEGAVAVDHAQVRRAGDGGLGTREASWRDALAGRWEAAGLEPPAPDDAFRGAGVPAREGRALLDRLVEEGVLTRVASGLYFHATPLLAARDAVRAYLSDRPLAAVGELKDLLAVSRKYLIPLLEYFDREGLTRRTPAGRSLARR